MANKLSICLALIFTFALVFSAQTSAITQSENFELSVPSSSITISGRAAPTALVTVKAGSTTIGTTTSNNLGDFSILVNRSPGIHKISVFYDDVNSVRSATSQKTLSVGVQSNTEYEVFLSPTIIRSTPLRVVKGSLAQIRGYTYANSQVRLSIDFGKQILTGQSDSNGFYEFLVNTDSLSLGSHTATSLSSIGSENSQNSNIVNFVLLNVEEEANRPGNTASLSEPDLIVSPNILPPPIPQNPEDGSVIEGQNVLVSGESRPNAQINIYQNGEIYGSIFADQKGFWSFNFSPTFSPVTLTFEACLQGKCSLISKTLTLDFPNLESACKPKLKLQNYRFWGVSEGDDFYLEVISATSEGLVEIDWGDGVWEKFDFDGVVPTKFSKRYDKSGQFNGRVIFYEDQEQFKESCFSEKYFSVEVSNQGNGNLSKGLSIFAGLLLLFGAGAYWIRKRHKPKIKKH